MEENKAKLRKILSAKRNSIQIDEKKIYDNMVFNNFFDSTFYKNAETIFIYVSYKSEVYTHNIIKHSLNDGKNICVPYILSKEKGMIAVKINSFDELKTGSYNILEPAFINNTVNPKDIDLAVVPGLAFDICGGRLGYGGGFYDRYFKLMKINSLKYGLSYSLQIVEDVPKDIWDIKLNGLITEKSVINIRG